MPEQSIFDEMKDKGVSRRDFMKLCSAVAGAIGLNLSTSSETDRSFFQTWKKLPAG